MIVAPHASLASSDTKLIALIGNPNSGKTTLFNRLTGLRHKVANYPGVTVERREGRLNGRGDHRLLDLPGCYSLTPRSLDQRIARDALFGWADGTPPPDALLVVVDASNLERNLFLATQAVELNLPTVIACNMIDIVRKRGDRLDVNRLARELGVPVVGTVASTGEGIDALRDALETVTAPQPHARRWSAGARLDASAARVAALLKTHRIVPETMADAVAVLMLSPAVLDSDDASFADLPPQVRSELAGVHRPPLPPPADSPAPDRDGGSPSTDAVQARYRWLTDLSRGVLTRADRFAPALSERIDRIVTHRVCGMAIFIGLMLIMLLAVFSWAAPLMNAIDWAVGRLGDGVASLLGPGALCDLLVDGVIAGVGNVVVFFPQICILFLFIAVLEDSGYMARVAFVTDRLMSKVGLHGRSFIPLLSSFACAVPAILATRTIENRRDRIATMMVAPLMSCSARLPIYIILISALFGTSVWLKVGILFAMYALGLVTALLVAAVLKRTLLRGPTPAFIMELPPYRMPRPGAAIRSMWDRSKLFLTQAGSIILAMSVLLWALAYFPRAPETATASDPGAQLRQSYMGRIGRTLEPAIKPLGFDWKIGVGLTASFAAREVFVATMGVVYGVGDGADEQSTPLRTQITSATWPDGRKVFTPLVGVSLMVFYVLACQCMSTIAVVRRETNGWRWPLFMFTYMTVLAYVASFVVYQGGQALGLLLHQS